MGRVGGPAPLCPQPFLRKRNPSPPSSIYARAPSRSHGSTGSPRTGLIFPFAPVSSTGQALSLSKGVNGVDPCFRRGGRGVYAGALMEREGRAPLCPQPFLRKQESIPLLPLYICPRPFPFAWFDRLTTNGPYLSVHPELVEGAWTEWTPAFAGVVVGCTQGRSWSAWEAPPHLCPTTHCLSCEACPRGNGEQESILFRGHDDAPTVIPAPEQESIPPTPIPKFPPITRN